MSFSNFINAIFNSFIATFDLIKNIYFILISNNYFILIFCILILSVMLDVYSKIWDIIRLLIRIDIKGEMKDKNLQEIKNKSIKIKPFWKNEDIKEKPASKEQIKELDEMLSKYN